MFCLRKKYVACVALCAIFSTLSAQSSDFEFRKHDDNNFWTYSVRLVSLSTERFLHEDGDESAVFSGAESETRNTRVSELATAYSFHIASITENLGLRLEPEMTYILSSGGSEFGFALPLRFQYGAMSTTESYGSFGVGFVVSYGTHIVPTPMEHLYIKIPTGFQYRLLLTGARLGASVLTLELGYSEYYVEGESVAPYKVGYNTSQFMIGVSLCKYDL